MWLPCCGCHHIHGPHDMLGLVVPWSSRSRGCWAAGPSPRGAAVHVRPRLRYDGGASPRCHMALGVFGYLLLTCRSCLIGQARGAAAFGHAERRIRTAGRGAMAERGEGAAREEEPAQQGPTAPQYCTPEARVITRSRTPTSKGQSRFFHGRACARAWFRVGWAETIGGIQSRRFVRANADPTSLQGEKRALAGVKSAEEVRAAPVCVFLCLPSRMSCDHAPPSTTTCRER
jgi:hypothetical protein